MKFAGHTMGTPNLDIFGAIDLFADIGYDGIEVRVQTDGQLWVETYSEELGKRVRDKLFQRGLEVCCLTPYFRDYVHADKRDSELAAFKQVVDMAADLKCPLVRSYGGGGVPEGEDAAFHWDRTVSGIRECAEYAAERGVGIAIETHIGSLTFSAGDTVRMVRDIAAPNVGILFDFAWVDIRGEETTKEGWEMSRPYVLHCHVKDWVIESRAEMAKKSCLMGEGDVPWQDLLPLLAKSCFEGYIVDEYEKYWYDHLPEASIGMRQNLEFVRRTLAR